MDDDELVRLYLTGGLDEEAAEGLEQRLLTEDDLFELCEAVEADLLAASARGELASAEREQVLHRLAASPQGRARLALAKGLTALADGRSETQPLSGLSAALPFRRVPERRFHPALQVAALAASLLILLGGAWLAVQRMQAGDALARIAQETPRLESPAPSTLRMPEKSPEISETPSGTSGPAAEKPPVAPRPEPQPARPNPPKVTALLQLSLAVRRSAEGLQQLRIPAGTEQLEIQVDLGGEESYEAFRATLSEPGGDPLWTRDSIEPRQMEWGTVLLLDVPARILPSGRYQIEVEGLEPEGTPARLGIQEFEVLADQ